MSKKPLVSIIIANNSKYKPSKKFLNRCVSSIRKCTTFPYEIIIKDGAYCGPAKARNLASQKARGRYLLFLDYDTIINSTALCKVLEYLEKNPKIGGGQLKLLRLDKKDTFDSAGEKLTPFGFLAERAQSAKDIGQFNQVENIFSGKGAAMIVRKSIFDKINGFDEDYFMYWEEPDLTWRIWKAGFKFIFLPMGNAYHAYGSTGKPVSKEWIVQITYLACRNQIMTIIKNGVGFYGLKMLITVTIAWVGLLFLFIIKLDFKKARAVLKAFIWIFKNKSLLLNKRKKLKKDLGERFFEDKKWFYKVQDKRNFNWYLRKAFAYINNKPY